NVPMNPRGALQVKREASQNSLLSKSSSPSFVTIPNLAPLASLSHPLPPNPLFQPLTCECIS
ncbi:unnamed protein product, partial [Closterium sp. NIES-53]